MSSREYERGRLLRRKSIAHMSFIAVEVITSMTKVMANNMTFFCVGGLPVLKGRG